MLGERRFVGLYTSSAYHADPREIPLLRRKVATAIERAGFRPFSHAYKNLLTVLQEYPRDELFQVDEDTLQDTAMGVLRLGDRRKTRVFVRRDLFGRFYSCLVYMPRESFNTDARVKVQEILKRHLHGSSAEFTVHLSEATLARLHVLVRSNPREAPAYDIGAIEAEITAATRRWEEDLKAVLIEAHGEERAVAALRDYGQRLPARLPRGRCGPARRCATSTSCARWMRRRRSPWTCIAPRAATSGRCACASTASERPCRSRGACRCWRTWGSRCWTRSPTR